MFGSRSQPALVRLPVQPQRPGGGQRLLDLAPPASLLPRLDPFVAVQHFQASQPLFPAHPHAGCVVLSYLFDDSQASLRVRDSLGFDGELQPGALRGAVAGGGLVHEEQPEPAGRMAHGLQLALNLPCKARLQAPSSLQLESAQMPRLQGPGWRGRVVFGNFAGQTAPLPLPLQAALVLIEAEAGATLRLPLAGGEQGWALLIEGQAQPLTEILGEGEAFAFAQPLALRAVTALRLVVGTGLPLRQPLVRHGPFVMDTEAQIVDAMRRYQQGDMGRLPAR